MKAGIDADIFTYSFGSCTDDFGHPLAWPLVATRLNAQIKGINDAVGSDSYKLYLTGSTNFRVGLASIRPYKGSRPTDKPYWYEQIRKYLISFRGATLIEGYEADDQLSIDLMSGEIDILCSIDKDLNNTPGEHYNWIKDEIYKVTEIEGLRNFYCQLLTGDSVDNIPGLHGVGKSSTYVKRVRSMALEYDMFDLVGTEYNKRFGTYADQFLNENAALLWMLREVPVCGNEHLEIKLRLMELKNQSLGQSWKKELLNSLQELG